MKSLQSALNFAQSEQVNFIIFTGDFCDAESLPMNATRQDFLGQIAPIHELLNDYPLPIYFVPGNHDPKEIIDIMVLESREKKVHSLHGTILSHENLFLGGIGGSHFVVPQLNGKTVPFPEGRFPELIEIPDLEHLYTYELSNKKPQYIYSGVHKLYKENVFPCDILVTHTPPFRPERDSPNIASVGLMALISEFHPLLSISGHIHNPKKTIETIQWDSEDSSKITTLIRTGELIEKKIFLVELTGETEYVCNVEIIRL